MFSLSAKPITPLKFQRYTIENGLSQGTILSMHQDKKGFIWLGTEGGLNRFDGYEFTQFKSIKGHDVRAIAESPNGDLWVGTTDALNVLRNGQETFDLVSMVAMKSIKSKSTQSLTFDGKGVLWIGTEQGLFKKEPGSNIEKVNIEQPNSSPFIVSITEISSGIMWIGTSRGVIEINQATKNQKLIQFNGDDNDIHIRAVYKNSKNDIWIATYGNGLFCMRHNEQKIVHYLAPEIIENRVYAISEDSKGRMWFGMDTKGIQIFEYGKGFHLLTHDPADSQSISGNAIEKFLVSNNGDIWVGTTRTGLNHHRLGTENFIHLKNRTSDPVKLLSNDVISMGTDNYARLWMGTFGEGWAVWDNNKQHMTYITANEGLVGNHPKGLVAGEDGFIWLLSEVGITKVKANNLKIVNTFTSDNSGFAGGQVTTAIDDKNGHIWFGYYQGGIGRISKADSTFELYNTANSQIPSNTIDKLLLSPNGDIWIATRSGLALYSPSKNEFTHYPKYDDERNYYFNDISLDKLGWMWISSPTGIHRFNTLEMLYEEKPVITDEPSYKLLTDSEGLLWTSTNHGLLRLPSQTTPPLRLTRRDGVQGAEFNSGAGVAMENGALAFGGVDGATIFHPSSILPLTNEVKITQVLILSESGNDTKILNGVLDKIIIPSNSLGLTLSLSSLNFEPTDKVGFRYREINGKWISSQANKIFIPVNKSGEFSYELASTNYFGEWQQPSKIITLSIAPPWYLNSFTIFLYVTLSILFIYLAYKIRVNQLNEKARKLEKLVQARTTELAQSNSQITKQAEELKLIASQKTQLYETISHELRTPITLIMGPAKKLSQQLTDKSLSATASLIERNATRLNRLVNQLMDLSRSESNPIKSTNTHADLSMIVRRLFDSFKPYASDAGISLDLDCHDEIIVSASHDSAEKIISNLLTNAIKYSRSGDSIHLIVSEQIDNATIKIVDTGIGIATEHLDDIFTRFYRVNAEQTATIEGSGIGLSIVKKILDDVNGKIYVKSKLNAGTTFTIELPLYKSQTRHQNLFISEPESEGFIEDDETVNGADKPHLLLIDDNDDILTYVSSLLSGNYLITTAKNGDDGIQKARAFIPDIIVSDIMMPGINGLELLETLKNDELTNHIPIIMLTAKGGSKIDGLKLRADDYIAKPFDENELLLRLRNLIDARDIIKQKFIFEHINESNGEPNTLQLKSPFIMKLDGIIEQHYQNSSFSVAELAIEAAIGERQLLRKLKAESDMGPKEYIRTYRLKKAATLIANGNTASFTANEVGFSSQAYFSSCFKAFYNQTPSQFTNK